MNQPPKQPKEPMNDLVKPNFPNPVREVVNGLLGSPGGITNASLPAFALAAATLGDRFRVTNDGVTELNLALPLAVALPDGSPIPEWLSVLARPLLERQELLDALRESYHRDDSLARAAELQARAGRLEDAGVSGDTLYISQNDAVNHLMSGARETLAVIDPHPGLFAAAASGGHLLPAWILLQPDVLAQWTSLRGDPRALLHHLLKSETERAPMRLSSCRTSPPLLLTAGVGALAKWMKASPKWPPILVQTLDAEPQEGQDPEPAAALWADWVDMLIRCRVNGAETVFRLSEAGESLTLTFAAWIARETDRLPRRLHRWLAPAEELPVKCAALLHVLDGKFEPTISPEATIAGIQLARWILSRHIEALRVLDAKQPTSPEKVEGGCPPSMAGILYSKLLASEKPLSGRQLLRKFHRLGAEQRDRALRELQKNGAIEVPRKPFGRER